MLDNDLAKSCVQNMSCYEYYYTYNQAMVHTMLKMFSAIHQKLLNNTKPTYLYFKFNVKYTTLKN